MKTTDKMVLDKRLEKLDLILSTAIFRTPGPSSRRDTGTWYLNYTRDSWMYSMLVGYPKTSHTILYLTVAATHLKRLLVECPEYGHRDYLWKLGQIFEPPIETKYLERWCEDNGNRHLSFVNVLSRFGSADGNTLVKAWLEDGCRNHFRSVCDLLLREILR